jgi:hypothetical protein
MSQVVQQLTMPLQETNAQDQDQTISYYHVLKHVTDKMVELDKFFAACTTIYTDFQNATDIVHSLRKTVDAIRDRLKLKYDDDVMDLVTTFRKNMQELCPLLKKLETDLCDIQDKYGSKLVDELESWNKTFGELFKFQKFILSTKTTSVSYDFGGAIFSSQDLRGIMQSTFQKWAKDEADPKIEDKSNIMFEVWKSGGTNDVGVYDVGYDALQNQILNIRSQIDNNCINKEIQIINSLSSEGRGVNGMISLVAVKNAKRSV